MEDRNKNTENGKRSFVVVSVLLLFLFWERDVDWLLPAENGLTNGIVLDITAAEDQ